MLYNCYRCGRYSFDPACTQCGEEARSDNIPLDPKYYAEFQYESQGVVKDLFLKKKTEKALDAKLESVLAKYREFETPYFVNYMHLSGHAGEETGGQGGYESLDLFQSVLVRLGFDELRELEGLTVKLVRSTSFRFQYHAFVQRTMHHLKEDFTDSIRSWIDERGSAFRRDLPLLLYLFWERKKFLDAIRFSDGTVPLVDGAELGRLGRLCEAIYFDLLVTRFKTALENFDPAKFVTIYRVDAMDGYEFEDFLGLLFNSLGYDIQTTKRSADQGADLFVEKYGRKIVIQAKNYSDNVGNAAVQQVLAAKAFYGCDAAMVVTNSYFTPSARELAESGSVTLVDRTKLQEYLDEYNRVIMDDAARASREDADIDRAG